MIDPRPLAELRADLGGRATDEFVQCFLDMLDGRVARVCGDVSEGDLEDAVVAAMSLHGSAVMVGAQDLAALTAQLLTLLRGDGGAAAQALTAQLPAVAATTSRSLRDLTAAGA